MSNTNNRLEPRERYERDPSYRALVDSLMSAIHQAQYTPTELREAVILAAIRYEERFPRPIIMVRKDEPACVYEYKHRPW